VLLAAASSSLTRDDRMTTMLPVADDAAVALTLASNGYPDAPRRGDAIAGVDAARRSGALVFGAGVAADNGVGLVTAGGRVLTVVGRGRTLHAAAATAYEAAERISFSGRQMRRDIGRANTARPPTIEVAA
jgi:phosphoribosylamine--glycine ligase